MRISLRSAGWLTGVVLTLVLAILWSATAAAGAEEGPGYDTPLYSYDASVDLAPSSIAALSAMETGADQSGIAVASAATARGRIYDSSADLVAPRTGVLVEGAGSGTRTINFRPNAADPNWGLTQRHLNKHLFGSGQHSLSTIDAAGNPALWTDYIQDLAGRPVTKTTSNGMQDIIGTFPLADGSGTFQFGIRIAPNTDGTFDLITLLTRQ